MEDEEIKTYNDFLTLFEEEFIGIEDSSHDQLKLFELLVKGPSRVSMIDYIYILKK